MKIEIPEDMENLLVEISKKFSLDPSAMALKALEEYLEDKYDYQIGVESYNEYVRNGKKSISLDSLKKQLKI